MKFAIHIWVFVLLSNVGRLSGQACNPPHQNSCDLSTDHCTPSSLANITCTPFRFTGLEGYWSFVGDGSTITIRVTPNICFPGPPPGDGIAAQLLEECIPVTVLPPPSHNLTDIVYRTRPCKVYTLYVVKVAGCSCDEIIINVGTSGGGAAPMIQRPVRFDVRGNACYCNEIEICANASGPCDLLYRWEINGTSRGDLDDLDCIPYEFVTTDPVTICVDMILGSEANPCDEVRQCTTIVPTILPPVVDPLLIVCWEDHMDQGYQWYDEIIYQSCINPPCTTAVQDNDGCCYDLIQPILLRKQPEQKIRSVFLCDSTELPFVSEDGYRWREEVCNEIVEFKDPIYGCDTSYYLSIEVLDLESFFGRICDQPDELTLTAQIDLNIDCPLGAVNYRLEWVNCSDNQLLSTDTFLVVTRAGEYCLDVILSFTHSNGTPGTCVKRIGEFVITDNDFGQTTLSIDGDLRVCSDQNGVYSAVPNFGVTEYNWSIPSGNGVIITNDPLHASSIEVKWDIMPGDSGIVCLQAAEECIFGDTCVVVYALGRPQPQVMDDTVVCGRIISLDGLIDQPGGSWTVLASMGDVRIDDTLDIHSRVVVDSFGTFTFVWSEGADGCSGGDTVNVSFRETPMVTLLDTICDPEGKYYHVVLQLEGGEGPYRILTGGGRIDSLGVYQSDTIWANGTLDLTIMDDYGCMVTYSLRHQCDCGDIQAGTLDNQLREACVDDCIEVFTNNDHILESGQCVIMVLHRDSLLDLNDPFADTLEIQSFDPGGNEFCFDAQEMNAEQHYYVHYMVTQCDPMSGEADLLFTCLQYVTVPLVFHDYPKPDLGEDIQVCGLDTLLFVSPGMGNTGYWEKIDGPGNALFAQDMSTSPVMVDVLGRYTFVWTEDHKGCEASDTIQIEFLGAPSILDWVIECDSLMNNYRVIVRSVSGGDSSSYLVFGRNVNGGSWQTSQNNNEWVSPWIVSGDSILLFASDRYACQIDTVAIDHECDCATSLGRLSVSPNMFCGPEGEVASNYFGGSKGLGDIVVFYLHEGDENSIGNIVQYNQNGVFDFDPTTMQLNQTYYISVRVGEDDGSGRVNPEYECLIETPGISVVWYDVPEALINAERDTFFCDIDSIRLNAFSSVKNALVGVLTYRWEMGGSLGQTEELIVTQPGSYQLIVTNDVTGCSDTTEINIGYRPGPEQVGIEIAQPECAGRQKGSIEILNVVDGEAPYRYRLDDGDIVMDVYFGDLDNGIHRLTIIDRNGCTIDTSFEILEVENIEVKAREDQYIKEGASIDLDSLIQSFSGDTNGVRFYWVGEDGDSILIGTDPTLLDSLYKSEYPFTLIAINEAGCISVDHLTIYVRLETPTVYIPNVISPNGDNINDIFKVYVSSDKIDHIDKLRIYTRWGELVFENEEIIHFNSSGTAQSGWDGTFNGEPLNPAVFVYTVDLVDDQGRHQLFAGSLTLIK